MERWRALGADLERHLRPATFPVAVRFLPGGEEPPQGARRPLDETGCKIAVCQALTLTRERGLTLAMGLDDSSCPLVNAAMGWDASIAPEVMMPFFQAMNYARDEESARKRAEGMARLEPGAYPAVVFSPLTRTRVVPDVVLVYANPAQAMRLVHAVTHWTGERVAADFGGLAGSCNEAVVRTFVADSPRVALPGNGDRVFATAHDDELIFAFPESWADRIVEGLQATADRGVRYPIPTFMDYNLPFVGLMAKFGS